MVNFEVYTKTTWFLKGWNGGLKWANKQICAEHGGTWPCTWRQTKQKGWFCSFQRFRNDLQFFSVVANHDFRQDQTSTVRNLAIFPHFSIKLHHAFRYTHFFYPFLSGHKRRKPLETTLPNRPKISWDAFFLFVRFHVDPCPCRRPQLGAIDPEPKMCVLKHLLILENKTSRTCW